MHIGTIFKRLLGVKKIIIKDCYVSPKHNSKTGEPERQRLVIQAQPPKAEQKRCPICGKKAPLYDQGSGTRHWRAMDLGPLEVIVESRAPRVKCPEHGVIVARVPWARHDSKFVKAFEQLVAWCTLHMTRSAVSEQLQIAWNTVGPVVKRVYDDLEKQQPHSKFDNLTCIGIDETSYKKGHKYMTVVVDNANATIIWASKEHGASVLSKFFEMLTPEQRAKIEYVTGDGARWIKDCANKYCKKAEFCIDPFHVTSWATAALDEVRREVYNQAKNGEPSREKGKRGRPTKGTPKKGKEASKVVKGAKFALLRNPENISENQAAMIHIIAKSNPLLYRAYQLKELLRLLMKLPLESAQKELDRWIGWARRSRIPTFVNLQKKICRHYYSILSTIKYGLSNSRIEAVNNNIKVTSRMGYGFRNVDNLIALIMMKCSRIKVKIPGLCPEFVWF